MAAEATYLRDDCTLQKTAVAAIDAGEVQQLADGSAGVFAMLNDAASGDRVGFVVEGMFTVAKTTGIVLLDGMPVYWDHSANKAHFRKVNDRDFYLGTVVGDAASADTTVVVNLNVQPAWTIDALRDGGISVATGTAAAGGFDLPRDFSGAKRLMLTATNEAQCVDILSTDRVAVGANPIVQAVVRIGANGSTNAVDFSIGLANGTSTTDADAITEHVLIHVDGGDLSLFAQSKDGTTTVTATDTTVDATAGTAVANRFEVWMDARDPASVKLYVDGVRVLSGTTFVLTAATGPLGLLAHLEKTTGTATGTVYVDALRAKTSQD